MHNPYYQPFVRIKEHALLEFLLSKGFSSKGWKMKVSVIRTINKHILTNKGTDRDTGQYDQLKYENKIQRINGAAII